MKKILLLLSIPLLIYGKDTLFDVSTPYSTGTYSISPSFRTASGFDWGWSHDTITFTNGVKITFNKLDENLVRFWALNGGILFIDLISSVSYKYSPSLNIEYNHTLDYVGACCYTIDNPDIEWNSAIKYPDSTAPIDTFACLRQNLDYYDPIFFRAKCFFFEEGDNMSTIPDFHAFTRENFNALFYFKTNTNRHMKMQISKVKLTSSGANSRFYSLEFRWAADSLGDGVFKHDPVKIAKKTFKKQHIELNSIKNIKKIEIYDLMGRKVKTLPAGADVAKWKKGNGVYIVRYVGESASKQYKVMVNKAELSYRVN